MAAERFIPLHVRARDGRTTTVRLGAASTVRDLKAALCAASFPPSPTFHLFLRGAKLILDAKLGNLPVVPGEFISLIPFSTRATPPIVPPSPSFPRRAPWPSPWAPTKRRRFSWHGGGGSDVDVNDIYAPKTIASTPSSSSSLFHCHGKQPLDPAKMVEHLRQGLGKDMQIAHVEEISGREATFAELPGHLSDAMKSSLTSIGVTRLYAHQDHAVESAVSGKHVVVSTSTSSGKSLCYNIPVLEAMSRSPAACALYIFPTKALAQDQLKTLLAMDPGLAVEIYDGDTPVQDRARIRGGARLLITNPDMLHLSILPCHGQFRRILSNLRYIVVDEAHSYKGAFGCHTALVLRRLRRVCSDVYGCLPSPAFIFCTATLANPREHVMELAKLDEDEVELVEKDTSPCGAKHFVLWNPGPAGGATPSRSPVQQVSCLFAEMVRHGLRCIAFCKTRKLCEQVLMRTREILEETEAAELVGTICVYRGGYVAADRRRIEADLFGGRLHGVAATNALELGIDVGHMDATLHLGFPGSMASLWQQAGRSGRRTKESMAVYVAMEGALDQFFMHFPHKLFGKPIEHCQVDSSNRKVLGQHLACAAAESPLRPDHDDSYFGAAAMTSVMATMADEGLLKKDPSASGAWRSARRRPWQSVSIRAIEHDKFVVMDGGASGRVLEEIEESKAFFQVHEGAVYMHQGATYLVESLALSPSRTAYVRMAADLTYYTRTEHYTEVHLLAAAASGNSDSSDDDSTTITRASECRVTTTWSGYRRICKATNKASETIEINLPPYSFDTQAVWATIPPQVRAAMAEQRKPFQEGVHGAAHALLSILPLHIMCGSGDLGTECGGDTRPGDRILLYDKHPGGIGLASQVRVLFADLAAAAVELVSACGCGRSDGCPNCIQSFACGEYNKNLDKEATVMLLHGLIQCSYQGKDDGLQRVKVHTD